MQLICAVLVVTALKMIFMEKQNGVILWWAYLQGTQGVGPIFPKFRHDFILSADQFSCCRMDEDRQVRQKLSAVPFHIDQSVISSIADAVSKIQNSLKTSYASATDTAFTARIEKALQKNLDYIEK